MSRRKNHSMKHTAKGKFTGSCLLTASSRPETDWLQRKANEAWNKYRSCEATEKLSASMFHLALEHVREDVELDDIPDEWYAYEVERTTIGDFSGVAKHHGFIADGARYMCYDALSYEEVKWFGTRFEAEAWAFWKAVLAHGSCETFISGVRYYKPNGRWMAFINEYEGVSRHNSLHEEE